MIANMDAELIQRRKFSDEDGFITEIVIWKVPEPVAGSRHPYKYRLFFGVDGKRIVGFDNERGKGDHKHLGPLETDYDFETVEQLIKDFYDEIGRSMTTWQKR